MEVESLGKDIYLSTTRKQLFAGGVIIKAPTITRPMDFPIVGKIIKTFSVDHVLVIDNDSLFTHLKETQTCEVLKLPKNSGCVKLSKEEKDLS